MSKFVKLSVGTTESLITASPQYIVAPLANPMVITVMTSVGVDAAGSAGFAITSSATATVALQTAFQNSILNAFALANEPKSNPIAFVEATLPAGVTIASIALI